MDTCKWKQKCQYQKSRFHLKFGIACWGKYEVKRVRPISTVMKRICKEKTIWQMYARWNKMAILRNGRKDVEVLRKGIPSFLFHQGAENWQVQQQYYKCTTWCSSTNVYMPYTISDDQLVKRTKYELRICSWFDLDKERHHFWKTQFGHLSVENEAWRETVICMSGVFELDI